MDLREYQRLKDHADRLRRQADEALGAFKQLDARVKEEFGCRTPEEEDKLLARLEKEQAELEKELERVLRKYERKWGERLGESNGK
jgi:predicted transcriptional regulator